MWWELSNWLSRAAALGLLLAANSCARQAISDPREAADAYAQAAQRGDADAIYGMLSSEAQRTYGREGTRGLVEDAKKELAAQGKAVASPKAKIRARARVRFIDGEEAALVLDDGEFRIDKSGAFPAGARTPQEALAELREALARRSFAQLIRVLSAESRSALENDLRSLVEGLEDPQTLDIRITGDRAEVTLPGGHSVKLEREEGVWRVEDFD